jgi:hypothetical protein
MFMWAILAVVILAAVIIIIKWDSGAKETIEAVKDNVIELVHNKPSETPAQPAPASDDYDGEEEA